MPDNTPRLYEGLFLVNQAAIAGDLDKATADVHEMLRRIDAEVLTLGRWDERRLAYPIAGQKRGLYILAIFRAAPDQLVTIERECNLSDIVLRVMVVRADQLGEAELEMIRDSDKTAAVAQKLMQGVDGGDEESAPQAAEQPAAEPNAEQPAAAPA
ncbi:MAG: 30S ribosomal protein S6 [Planctomycetota bacterium]